MDKLKVLGGGSYCFDTIVVREYPDGFTPGKRNKGVDRIVMEEIGSNPGNVMSILGYFGWDSYPIAFFDDYPQGYQMKKDFERYHCNTRFVSNTPQGGTNCFSVIHCLDDETGKPIMKHSKKHAPFSGFPRDKALTVQGEDSGLSKFIKVLDFLPDVYFFEGGNPGWRELGRHLHNKGVLVYYEVQSSRNHDFGTYFKGMEVADIVKFSDETFPDADFVSQLKDKLVIQTLGPKGIRFNLLGQGWVSIAAEPVDRIVDTEGCGDWTTASFINAIGKRGILTLGQMTPAIVEECLREAQGYATRNLGFMGTKGIIAADKDFNLEPSRYVDTIMAEMDGHIGVPMKKAKASAPDGVGVLSSLYPCELPYEYKGQKLVFNSVEQMCLFLRYQEFPNVQWMVMHQSSGNNARAACKGFKYVDTDYEEKKEEYLALATKLKHQYCEEFRKEIDSQDQHCTK